jgi:hypothetical protein
MFNHRLQVLGAAAVAACGMVLGAASVQAAPITYQNAVLADNPYVYYRLQETGTLTDQPAHDFSSNATDGIYRGNPVGGVTGMGTASDNAVSFPGTTNTGLDYLRTTNALPFGSQVGKSSYELVFKANAVNLTDTYQSIFGVFNQSDATTTPPRTNAGAVAIEFNSNSTGNPAAGTSRFYVRDEDGIALGATIDNGTLLDGNYHHLVFTYDDTDATQQYVKAYVDGTSVPVSLVPQGGGSLTNVPDNFLDFTRDPVFGARNLRGIVGNEANVTIDEAALYANSVLSAADVAAHAAAAGIQVPEPASLGLFAAAAGLGLLRRRRQAL